MNKEKPSHESAATILPIKFPTISDLLPHHESEKREIQHNKQTPRSKRARRRVNLSSIRFLNPPWPHPPTTRRSPTTSPPRYASQEQEQEVTVEREDTAATAAAAAEEERLRYLQFVQQAAAQALVLAAAAYAYAKQGAGPLRPGVDHVEGTVKAVVGPVYDRFHGVPLDLLKFLDRKVGESVEELDRRVPPVVKEAPTLARSAAAEVRQAGLVGTATGLAKSAIARAEPKARELYTRYEPVAERRAAEAWIALNRLPMVPAATKAVLPTAAQLSAKYNSAVLDGAKRGNTVATYLPLVPTERIARVFGPTADAAPVPEMQPIPSQ